MLLRVMGTHTWLFPDMSKISAKKNAPSVPNPHKAFCNLINVVGSISGNTILHWRILIYWDALQYKRDQQSSSFGGVQLEQKLL